LLIDILPVKDHVCSADLEDSYPHITLVPMLYANFAIDVRE